MRHALACAGHFWCNEQTHTANGWVIPLTLLTFVIIIGLYAMIRSWFRE